MIIYGTGSLPMVMKIVDYMSWTQIKSFSFSFLAISGLMIVFLCSLQSGIIAILPNLLPAVFSFGLMGWLGIPLDPNILIIIPLILGVAVDDTIHFIVHYRDKWFKRGNIDAALTDTMFEVGPAVIFTTLILSAGFSVLAFSSYLGIARTGVFSALAIFIALTSDLFFLPALIKLIKPDMGRGRYLIGRKNALHIK